MPAPPPGRTGVFPGSFDPPTVAHVAIAEAAVAQRGLVRVDLVVSFEPLGKDATRQRALPERLAALERLAAGRPWLGVAASPHRLLVDLAVGYDVLVLGADKWAQVLDPAFYGGSTEARDRAVAALPELAIAPRPPWPVPAEHLLAVPDHLGAVSSTAVRSGHTEWHAAGPPDAVGPDVGSEPPQGPGSVGQL